MTFPGSTRNRFIQAGRQSAFGTAVPATRRYPWSGDPAIDLGYEEDESDVGSIDRVMAPYRTAHDSTLPITGKANFNDLPAIYASNLKGGVDASGGGASKTWTYQVASLTQDDFDYFTLQAGDDVDADTWQLIDSVGEGFELSSPDNLGPFDLSATWRIGDPRHKSSTDSPVSGTVPTTGLTSDENPTRMFAADTELFIDDAHGSIGGTKISDAVYAIRFSFAPEIDQKRFMNGSNSRFALAGYTRGPRVITLSVDFAKADSILGTGDEVDHWFADQPVSRFVEVKTTSTVYASAGVPYSNSLRMPLHYRTYERGTRNNNTIITLTGQAFYDSDLGYALRAEVVNTLATASL